MKMQGKMKKGGKEKGERRKFNKYGVKRVFGL